MMKQNLTEMVNQEEKRRFLQGLGRNAKNLTYAVALATMITASSKEVLAQPKFHDNINDVDSTCLLIEGECGETRENSQIQQECKNILEVNGNSEKITYTDCNPKKEKCNGLNFKTNLKYF